MGGVNFGVNPGIIEPTIEQMCYSPRRNQTKRGGTLVPHRVHHAHSAACSPVQKKEGFYDNGNFSYGGGGDFVSGLFLYPWAERKIRSVNMGWQTPGNV